MKKIINGKVYDTAKARELGTYRGGDGFSSIDETLYQKRTGEFFLYGVGGPATKYAHSVGLNQWSGGDKIIPLDVKAARQWVEEHLDADDYERIFGLPDEDAEPVALYVTIPAQLAAVARQRAAEDGVALTTLVERALSSYLNPERTPGMYWWLIDDCTSSRSVCDEDRLDVRTQTEAIQEARLRWDRLSDHDRKERDTYYICLAGRDEDNCIDYSTQTHVYNIK